MCYSDRVERKRQSPEAAAAAMCRLISRECRVDIATSDLIDMVQKRYSKLCGMVADIIAIQPNDLSAARNAPPDTQ